MLQPQDGALSAASGRAGRGEPAVSVVEMDSGEFYIVVSSSASRETQVVSIDPSTGLLEFTATPGVDVFESEAKALRSLDTGGRVKKTVTTGRALVGYAVLGVHAVVLLALRAKPSVEGLPVGTIYTIVESQWVKIPLKLPRPWPRTLLKSAADFPDISIDSFYFFCESGDLTRTFPSRYGVRDPEHEFVWNSWLSAPLRAVGLPDACVVLLQGLAECRSLVDNAGNRFSIALIARRSRLHPGTRYLARGLNAACSTGNEVEVEQIVWRQGPAGEPQAFSTYVWRRGTVPIWWGADIKSAVSEAEIYIGENPYEGSAEYYRNLARRYAAPSADGGGAAGEITCINLLRCSMGRPEMLLSEHFQESIRQVRKSNALDSCGISIQNFDWHGSTKALGEIKTVEGLWALVHKPTANADLTMGTFCLPGAGGGSASGGGGDEQPPASEVCTVTTHQRGVLRYNCADSLDRTNAASFFGAVQVLVEQGRRLGLSIDASSAGGGLSSIAAASSSLAASAGAGLGTNLGNGATPPGRSPGEIILPEGWESRVDAVTGKRFYIDHNTRKTQWTPPPQPAAAPQTASSGPRQPAAQAAVERPVAQRQPWTGFQHSFDELKFSLSPAALNALADMFQIAGDVHAMLYTGSRAMHSSIIHIFSDQAQKMKRGAAAANVAITLQRRYLNIMVDESRQQQLEILLGMRRPVHLPSLPPLPYRVNSRPPACLLKPVEGLLASVPAGPLILAGAGPRAGPVCWVAPPSAPSAEFCIFLSEPARVRYLLVTVAHGLADTTSPIALDVRVGRTLDSLKTVLKRASIPRCANGTCIMYSLRTFATAGEDGGSPASSGHASSSAAPGSGGSAAVTAFYDFDEDDEQIDHLARVVSITFHAAPGAGPTTVGQLEVHCDAMERATRLEREFLAVDARNHARGKRRGKLAFATPPTPGILAGASGAAAAMFRGAGASAIGAGGGSGAGGTAGAGFGGGGGGGVGSGSPASGGGSGIAKSGSRSGSEHSSWASGGADLLSSLGSLNLGDRLLNLAAVATGRGGGGGQDGAEKGRRPQLQPQQQPRARTPEPNLVEVDWPDSCASTKPTLRVDLRGAAAPQPPPKPSSAGDDGLHGLMSLAAGLGSEAPPPPATPERTSSMAEFEAVFPPIETTAISASSSLTSVVSSPPTESAGPIAQAAIARQTSSRSLRVDSSASLADVEPDALPVTSSEGAVAKYLEEARRRISASGKRREIISMLELEVLRLSLGLSAGARNRALRTAGIDPADADPNRCLNPYRRAEYALAAAPASADGADEGRDGESSTADPAPDRLDAAPPQGEQAVAAALLRQIRDLQLRRGAKLTRLAAARAAAWYDGLGLPAPGSLPRRSAPETGGKERQLARYPAAGFAFSVPRAKSSAPAEVILCGSADDATSASFGAGAVSRAAWEAPDDVTEVELAIVLSSAAIVTRLVLVVNGRGYSARDAPIVEVFGGETLADRQFLGRWDLAPSGGASGATSVSNGSLTGVDPLGAVPTPPRASPAAAARNGGLLFRPGQALSYSIKSHRCRIMWLRLSLRASADVETEESPMSLQLSSAASGGSVVSRSISGADLAELLGMSPSSGSINTTTAPKEAPRAPPARPPPSQSTVASGRATIHVGRIEILGVPVQEEAGVSVAQMSDADRYTLQRILGESSALARSRLPTQEEVKAGGRVVEMTVSAQAKFVSGFRWEVEPSKGPVEEPASSMDACAAMDVGATRIRVSAVPHDAYEASPEGKGARPVLVGEYTVPSAREGTVLHFDFPAPVAGRAVVFELLARRGAAAAELAAEDSLAGRIRLYRYTQPG